MRGTPYAIRTNDKRHGDGQLGLYGFPAYSFTLFETAPCSSNFTVEYWGGGKAGFSERVYERAFIQELKANGVKIETQKPVADASIL